MPTTISTLIGFVTRLVATLCFLLCAGGLATAQTETFYSVGAKANWTVPAPGIYRVIANGAQGGSAQGGAGGLGARVEGNFFFAGNQQLQLAVGGAGGAGVGGPDSQGGGGGGTFLVDAANTPLLVAGGGGGAGRFSQGIGSSGTGGGGVGGPGGNGFGGAGGGGFSSNGASTGFAGGGRSWFNGLAGGLGYVGAGAGGFGGGGGGDEGGGGGGGYSGGAGGNSSASGPGGGGTSYNTGTETNLVADANPGNGLLSIIFLAASPTISSITRNTPAGEATNADTLTFSVAFSEDVANLDVTDFEVVATPSTTATVTAVVSQGGASYAVTVSGGDLASFDGVVGIAVGAANNIVAAAPYNAPLDGTTPTGLNESYTLDNTAPDATLTSSATDPVTGAFLVDAVFTKPVTGLGIGGFTVTNGTASDLTGSGDTYGVTITPSTDGEVTVQLAAGSAEDEVGNGNAISNTLTRQMDVTAPTATLSSSAAAAVNGPFTVDLAFSETVTGLSAAGFVVTNGTASDLTGSGDTYAVTITPAADGEVTVQLAAASAQDAAGNDNAASNVLTRMMDASALVAALASSSPDPINGAFSIDVTFNKAVTGLTAAGFVVTNGTASDLTGSGDTYALTVAPITDGQVVVQLPAAAVQDAAGNDNAASNILTRQVDTAAPGATLSSSAAAAVNGPFTVDVAFTKPVTGLSAGGFTVTNGTASDLTGSGDAYAVTVTPAANGEVTVQLAAGSAQDAAGNGNEISNVLSRQVDASAPEATLSSTAPGTVNGPFVVEVAFTKPVTGLAADGFAVTNGSVSDLMGSGDSYTITIAPSADGEVTVQLPAGSAQDAIGNANLPSNLLSRQVDTAAPTATLSSSAPQQVEGAFVIDVAFSKPVTGLTAAAFTVVNGTASNLMGAAQAWTVTIAPTVDDGTVSVQLTADSAQDEVGNGNAASNVLTRQHLAVSEIQQAFTEVTGAYVARRMDRIMSSEPVAPRFENRLAAQDAPQAAFAYSEAGPGYSGRMSLQGGGDDRLASAFGMSPASPDGGVSRNLVFSGHSFAKDRRFFAWTEGQYGVYRDRTGTVDARKGKFGIVHLGADYLIGSNVAAGIMGHVDWTSERADGYSDVSGMGWMIGPYVSGRLAENLFFSARTALGRSRNNAAIDVFRSGSIWDGDFATNRWLNRASLYGRYQLSSVLLMPQIDLAWMRETQADFTVSNAGRQVAVNGATAEIGRASFSTTVEHHLRMGEFESVLFATPRIDWNFHRLGAARNHGQVQAGLEVGLRSAPTSPWQGLFSLRFDGIGEAGFDAVTTRAGLSRQF